jgi:hypothetical protein
MANCLVCRKPFKTIFGAHHKPVTYFCVKHTLSLTREQKEWAMRSKEATPKR